MDYSCPLADLLKINSLMPNRINHSPNLVINLIDYEISASLSASYGPSMVPDDETLFY